MPDEPRIYRHSTAQLRSQMLLGVLGALMLLGVGLYEKEYLLFVFAGIGGIIFGSIHSSRLKTIISDDGIFTRNIFGEKILRWSEISRVSGRGNEIRLHNFDGDVTLVPSGELAGYEEVVEQIGIRRPDLFDAANYPIFKKGTEYGLILPIIGALTIGLGAFLWIQVGEFGTLPFIAFLPIGLIVFGISAAAPQSVQAQGNSLRIRYLWREKTISAAEIQSVELAYQQSKNSKNYFVRLNLFNQSAVKLTGLNLSMPVVYLILKNWRGKNLPAPT